MNCIISRNLENFLGPHRITVVPSDGNPFKHPIVSQKAEGHRWSSVDKNSFVSKKWLSILGKGIATHLGLGIKGRREKWTLSNFPQGYELFEFVKGSGHTAYLFGYPTSELNITYQFLTPNEFLPHLKWLVLRTNLEDRTTCLCKKCQGKTSNSEDLKNQTQSIKNSEKNLDSKFSAEFNFREEEYEGNDTNFRSNELVWCHLTIKEMSPRLKTNYWPGICLKVQISDQALEVLNITSEDEQTQESVEVLERSLTPGNKRLVNKEFIRRTHSWHVQLLGLSDVLIKGESQLLPWLHKPFLESDWRNVMTGKIPAPDYILDITKSKPRISSLSNSAMVRLLYQFALQVGAEIEETWTPESQRSKEIDSISRLEDLEKASKGTRSSISTEQTRFYRLWLGAELLQTYDLVRLKWLNLMMVGQVIDGKNFEQDEDRVLLFEVFFFQKVRRPGREWMVAVAGRILRVVERSSVLNCCSTGALRIKEEGIHSPVGLKTDRSTEFFPPRKSQKLVNVTPAGELNYIGVDCIAGRYYSPKSFHSELSRLRNQSILNLESLKDSTKTRPGTSRMTIESLIGLKSGELNFMR
ncbi:hypothetical protein BY996DRAFT_4588436 [Phakopsora pachyrhizi]|uniref:Cryptic loci regulator 2 N-terminal domain-containing protein n=1 Tax=Phakopsora pachyrhizi TaxID=170000 RepID=A0AAV0ASM3_PHAPC|nr:hypothetical protein BY996DRAFT_4588436 [Phakopsora pachyrhizi]CAH7672525.1 hypothetical protein PPACK8108_LOCUS7344 [Phakopsora pachyrhizi]